MTNNQPTEEQLRIDYLELLLAKAKSGADDVLLNRIERVLGLAESDTQLHDRVEQQLVSMRLTAREDASKESS